MLKVIVKSPITCTVQPDSVIIVTESQAEALKGKVEQYVEKSVPKKTAKEKK